MATEPPPLFGDDDEEIVQKEDDDEDLFKSATETPNEPEKKDILGEKVEPEQKKEEPAEKKENGLSEEVDLEEDDEDLFAGGGTEIKLDSPEEENFVSDKVEDVKSKEPSSPPSLPVTETSPVPAPATKTTHSNDNSWDAEEKTKEEKEEESGDQFQMEITVTEPKKMGDGMGSYMAYKVNTKTTIPQFHRPETAVYRRFSDFLGLHDKLVEKYMTQGRIVPPAPEKSVIGMTKIKMSKEEAGSQEFVEKRRAALERYLNRTAKHPTLRMDSDFREFLEAEGDLPRSTSTSALSGAGVMRLFNKVGDSLGKMTFKMDETDQWFEEKQQQIEALDQQLRKLHSSIEALVQHRKELALNTGQFAKSAAMLGNAEEHTALSRALSQLAEVEEKIDQLHMDQADNDFFVFSELIKDYIALTGAVKEVFAQRVKVFKMWKETELNLTKKREQRAKLELQRKMDKIPAVSAEITDLENKLEKYQEDFEAISKVIRKEMVRFEKQRVKDFKSTIIHYLESLMNSQQQVIKYWEGFLPEAKAIA